MPDFATKSRDSPALLLDFSQLLWGNLKPKEPKTIQKKPKSNPKGANGNKNGPTREPKGSQNRPGTSRGTSTYQARFRYHKVEGSMDRFNNSFYPESIKTNQSKKAKPKKYRE